MQGSKSLQEMQLDKQLSQVTITRGEDHRTIEQIKINDTYRHTFQCRDSIIARSGDSLITIDYSCIDRAEQIWRNFHRYNLYTLIATTAVLAGLVTLSLSRVVMARYLVLPQLAVAFFPCLSLLEQMKYIVISPCFQGGILAILQTLFNSDVKSLRMDGRVCLW
jgi:hypothetical protein